MPVYLDGDTNHMLYPEQPIMLSARRHPNIMLLITLVKNFLNLNFISNIFQETHDLDFDRLSNYLYLFKKEPA